MSIVVSGERDSTCCTNASTFDLPCTVAVGLFGLQKKTRPAPLAAAAVASRSILSWASTLGDSTGWPRNLANVPGASKLGSGETSALVGDVNAYTPARSSSPDPQPKMTFDALTPCAACVAAIASTRSSSPLTGYRFDSVRCMRIV